MQYVVYDDEEYVYSKGEDGEFYYESSKEIHYMVNEEKKQIECSSAYKGKHCCHFPLKRSSKFEVVF